MAHTYFKFYSNQNEPLPPQRTIFLIYLLNCWLTIILCNTAKCLIMCVLSTIFLTQCQLGNMTICHISQALVRTGSSFVRTGTKKENRLGVGGKWKNFYRLDRKESVNFFKRKF